MKVHAEDIKMVQNCIKEFPTELMCNNWAQRIHGQSLDQLDQRGGMSVKEIVANVLRRDYSWHGWKSPDAKRFNDICAGYLRQLIQMHEIGLPVKLIIANTKFLLSNE